MRRSIISSRLFVTSLLAMLALGFVARGEPPRSAPESVLKLVELDRVYADPNSLPGKTVLSADDEKFLDDLQQRCLKFFIDEADPVTGLMPDRSRANGGPANDVASTASVGFGLTALCIGENRGWISKQEAYDRSYKVLRFLRDHGPQEHGHFYHFLNMRTGARTWNCEVSNIDTALLMAGVITVRQHFPDTDLAKLANELYERVEWDWLLNRESGLLCGGWKPEEGRLKAEWGSYSECPTTIILMGLGSRTHPLPASAWSAWRREPVFTFAGLTYIQCPPLFTHQYPQCWFDLRGLRDDYANYFKNSQLATIAQRQWSIDVLAKRFKTYGPNLWGITASDGPNGYKAWGGPDPNNEIDDDIDGVIVPCAAGGSIAFEPKLCIDALRAMKGKFGDKAYVKYGFVDAFNPLTGWYNNDVIGIDVGPTIVMAENCRTGFVWKTFMSSPEASRALEAAKFRPLSEQDMKQPVTTSIFTGARASGGDE